MIDITDFSFDSARNCSATDGVVTTVALNNYGWANIKFSPSQTFIANQEYYCSADIKLKSGAASKMNYLRIGGKTSITAINNPILTNNYQRYCFKIVLDEETVSDTFGIQIISGTNAVLEITNIMISTNSDYTYEKYTGEQPSPSPDYPSEIETVNGSVEIDVVNSNLLDFNVAQDSRVTVNEDGTLTINGTGGFGLNIDKLQLKAGITYYQKVELISGSISGSNINNTFLSFAGTGAWISSENFSQTNLAKDTEKTTIWINASAIFNNAVIKIWANIDKSDFVKHQSQTAIMPIQQEMLTGDYISSVEHHEWEKIIIDTSKLIVDNTKEEKKKRYRYEYDKNIKKSDATNNVAYSNTFKLLGEGQTYWNFKGFTIANNNIYIYDEGESLAEFISKIADKQLVFYAQLATPVDLELTEEQKSIRDTKLYTYKNITNIDVSDELASIDVTYKKDLETEHNKLQKEIDEIKQLISTTETSALLLDNLQKDVESEVE